MRALGVGAVVAAFGPAAGTAQVASRTAEPLVARAADGLQPTMLLVPRGDTVFVYFAGGIVGMPKVVLTRESPGQGIRELAVPTPLRDPAAVEAALGAQWPTVRELARVPDAGDLLRLLDRDPIVGAVLGALVRPIGVVTGRLVVDAGVVPGREVTYRAQFLDARGRPDGAPQVRRVRVADAPLTAPPTPRIATSDAGIRLSFIAPRPEGASDRVVAYVVERRIDAGAWERVSTAPLVRVFNRELAYDEALPPDGRRYEWRLRGLELSGRETPPSAAVATTRVDVTAPAATGETVARAEGTRVIITWAQAPEPDAAGYHLDRSTGANGPWTRLTTTPLAVNAPQYVDSTVPARRQHYWRVRTIDRAGNLGAPGSPSPATRLDVAPPPPVTGLVARAERGAMVVSWTAPSARDLLGAHVWRGDDSTRLVRLTNEPTRAATFREAIGGSKGLTPGASYVYRVAAVDSSRNESAPVTITVAVPDAVRPAAPTGLAARDEGGRYVELTWLPGGAPDIVRYAVTRRPAGAAATTRPVTRIAEVPDGTGPFTVRDSAITAGARYEYAVVAIDATDNASAPATVSAEVRTATPPPAPRFAAVERRGGGHVVRWERVVAETLAGYVVDRAPTPTGPFRRLTTTPVAGLTFTDASAPAGSWYVVRAVDRAGRESLASPPARSAP